MLVQQIPFLRILIPLLPGIVLGWYFPLSLPIILLIASIFAFLFFMLMVSQKYWQSRNMMVLRYGTGVCMSFFVLFFGMWLSAREHPKFQEHHIAHFNGDTLAMRVIEMPKTSASGFKSKVKIIAGKTQEGWQHIHGTAYLYLANTADSSISYGDTLIGTFMLNGIEAPVNPYEFDFQKFSAYQGIYHSIYVKNTSQIALKPYKTPQELADYVAELQEWVWLQLQNNIPGNDAAGIMAALFLGTKAFIPQDVIAAYSSAGVMHVLAVSGLHMGLVFVLISTLFGFMGKRRAGRMLLLFLTLFSLWAFALLAGLGPSVLRAAVMFSVIAIGAAFSEKPNVFNSLCFAAFLLLLFEPHLIFHVGFQLSFSAVWGIVYFQPRIKQLFPTVRSAFVRYFFDLTTVTLAATLVTIPITIYYFHQFPLYFIFTNLVIIPGVTVILYLGALLLFLATFWPLGAYAVGFLIENLVLAINTVMKAVSHLPAVTIQHLWIDDFQFWLLFTAFLSFVFAFHYKSTKTFRWAMACTLLLFVSQAAMSFQLAHTKAFYHFQLNKGWAWGVRIGFQGLVITDLHPEKEKTSLHQKVYPVFSREIQGLPNLYAAHDKVVLPRLMQYASGILQVDDKLIFSEEPYAHNVWLRKGDLVLPTKKLTNAVEESHRKEFYENDWVALPEERVRVMLWN
jgi:competence protein ComEC